MTVSEFIRRCDPHDLAMFGMGAALAALGVYDAGRAVLGGNGNLAGLALVGLGAGMIVFHYRTEIRPEHDTTCAVCDDPVRVDSAEDGFDAAVFVQTARSPSRSNFGWVSVIRRRDKFEEVVCSGECADRLLEEYREFREYVSRDDTDATIAEVSD